MGTKYLPGFYFLCIVCLHRTCQLTEAEILSHLSDMSQVVCIQFCLHSCTRWDAAQKYSAKSFPWAEGFLRQKKFASSLTSAPKPLMPETSLFPDVYFRRSWSHTLGYCTYQKRYGRRDNEQLHLSSRGVPLEIVTQTSGWVTDGARFLLQYQCHVSKLS